MTIQINRESLPCSPEQFAAALDGYIAALTEYNEHLKGVEADAADPEIAHENKRVAFPPPDAPLDIMPAAIGRRREDGALFADYELVGPSLDVRKQRLAQLVSEAEAAELAKVTPPAKARYWQMREQAILRADSERWNELQREGAADGLDFERFVRATQSEEDAYFLNDQENRRRKEQAIQFWAAKQHHDIDDLTEETVDGWELKPFNG